MDDDLKALCKRLEAVRYQREDWHEPYGAIDLPCDADDNGAVAVPRNPDGPEAAKAIRTLLSALRQRDEALEKIAFGTSGSAGPSLAESIAIARAILTESETNAR